VLAILYLCTGFLDAFFDGNWNPLKQLQQLQFLFLQTTYISTQATQMGVFYTLGTIKMERISIICLFVETSNPLQAVLKIFSLNALTYGTIMKL